MPELGFQISGIEPVAMGMTPLLQFKLHIDNSPASESIQALMLHVQIQIQPPARSYTEREKERLVELFGLPEQWGQTLRNRLWTHCNATIGPFTGHADTFLSLPCTYDLNFAATKYFYALDEGDVSLLFLFSGTAFYNNAEGRLQVQQIPWSKECVYRLPVRAWHELMEQHYPNSAWLYLQRDVFERLYAYRRRHGIPSWEQTIERLLPAIPNEVAA